MSSSISFYDSSNGSNEFVAAGRRVDGLGLSVRRRTLTPPGATEAVEVGDAAEIPTLLIIEGVIEAASGDAARTELGTIEDLASSATTLELSIDGTTHHRALLGLQSFRVTYDFNRVDRPRVQMAFLPKFARWTTTRAESAAAYSSATKAVV